jgi:hypothetical protein
MNMEMRKKMNMETKKKVRIKILLKMNGIEMRISKKIEITMIAKK